MSGSSVTPDRRTESRRWSSATTPGTIAAAALAAAVVFAGCGGPDLAADSAPDTATAIGAVAEPLGERSDDDPDGEALDSTPATATGAGGSPLAARIQPLPSATGLPDHDEAPIPVSLSIPTIGVDATAIVPVGVESNGEMEVPGPRSIGWYRYGAVPGDAGSTVLAAHIASEGVDGAFRHLADAQPGDRVSVALDDGTTATYEIVEVEQYDKAELPFDRVFARSGPESIALITCGGEFQPSLRSYEDNVVAYAVPLAD